MGWINEEDDHSGMDSQEDLILETRWVSKISYRKFRYISSRSTQDLSPQLSPSGDRQPSPTEARQTSQDAQI